MDPDQIVKNNKRDNDNDDEDDDEEEEEEEDVLTALVVVINTGTTGQPKSDQARKNPNRKKSRSIHPEILIYVFTIQIVYASQSIV